MVDSFSSVTQAQPQSSEKSGDRRKKTRRSGFEKLVFRWNVAGFDDCGNFAFVYKFVVVLAGGSGVLNRATTHLCGAQRSVKQSSATRQRKAGESLGSVED